MHTLYPYGALLANQLGESHDDSEMEDTGKYQYNEYKASSYVRVLLQISICIGEL